MAGFPVYSNICNSEEVSTSRSILVDEDNTQCIIFDKIRLHLRFTISCNFVARKVTPSSRAFSG